MSGSPQNVKFIGAVTSRIAETAILIQDNGPWLQPQIGAAKESGEWTENIDYGEETFTAILALDLGLPPRRRRRQNS